MSLAAAKEVENASRDVRIAEISDFQFLTTCLVCGSGRLHYLFSVDQNRFVRCDDCGLVLANPRPSEEQLASRREKYLLQNADTDACTERILDLLHHYSGSSSGRLLQVGCGRGDVMARASARGFEVTGIEASPAACAAARLRLRHLPVSNLHFGQIDELDRKERFDVVLLSCVLGQTLDPVLLLRKVRDRLQVNGVVVVVSPPLRWTSGGALKLKPNGLRPDQVFHFRSCDVETLLLKAGFNEVLAPKYEASPTMMMVHFARRAQLRPRPLLSVIVPAFNEVKTFARVISQLQKKQVAGVDLEIVVVESNSDDGTRDEVLALQGQPRIKIVLQDAPEGKGHAVREGLEHATGDLVLIQDADLEYDIEDYDALIEPLLSGRAACVLGARHGGSAWKMRQFTGQPLLAAVLNIAHWFFTAAINLCFGARLKDPFTMYKVFRRDCLHGLRFQCNRFDFDWELVIRLLQKGYTPLEIPVNYRSRPFAEGKKVSILRDPLTWLRTLIRLRISTFDPFQELGRKQRSPSNHTPPPRGDRQVRC